MSKEEYKNSVRVDNVSDEDVSIKEQNDHLKIFNRVVNSNYFDGLHVKGEFEEPALIFTIDRFPSKEVINVLNNSVNRPEDGSHFIYLYSKETKKAIKWGRMNKVIEDVNVISEILRRYNLNIVEVKDGDKKIIELIDLIGTFEIG